jgi:hypothetical protein
MKTEDPLQEFKALMIWIPIGLVLWALILFLLFQ